MLTVNGQSEIVVQDAASYQRLLDRAQEADRLMELRRSIAEFRGGRTRDVDAALGDLEARYGATRKQKRVRSGI